MAKLNYEDEKSARELRAAEKEAMGPWVAGLRPWQYFVTFTYDPVKVLAGRGVLSQRGTATLSNDSTAVGAVAVGVQKIRRDVERFVAESARNEGRCLDLAAGFEPHESGSLHVHGLAYFRGAASGHEIRSLHGSWFKRNGYIITEPVRSEEAVAKYCAKYCTKSAGEIFFSRRLVDAVR